jgi:hypothetical protein
MTSALASDLLGGEIPDVALLRGLMLTLSALVIGVRSGNTKWFQQHVTGQEDVVRAVAEHVREYLPSKVVDRTNADRFVLPSQQSKSDATSALVFPA